MRAVATMEEMNQEVDYQEVNQQVGDSRLDVGENNK